MKKKILMLCMGCFLVSLTAKAQWVVSDPGNLAQGIINAAKNIVHTSSTATNMANSFQETVKIYQQGKEYYDGLRKVKNLVRDARKVQQTILMVGDITDIYVTSFERMLSDPYFSQPAPKSTGREYFNYGWLERHLRHFPGVDPRDVQATVAELTAVTISEQVLLSGGCERLMVCGGGSRNPLLMARLAALLPGTEVTTTDAVGISGDDMEALAFAWLAWRTLAGLPGNLPSVTGASQETVLGAIFPANP